MLLRLAHLHDVALLDMHVNLDGFAVLVDLGALPGLAATQVGLATIVGNDCGHHWADPAGCKAALGPQAIAGAQERALHVAVLLWCAAAAVARNWAMPALSIAAAGAAAPAGADLVSVTGLQQAHKTMCTVVNLTSLPSPRDCIAPVHQDESVSLTSLLLLPAAAACPEGRWSRKEAHNMRCPTESI